MNHHWNHGREITGEVDRQRLWAQRHGFEIALSGDRYANPAEALMAELHPATRAELGEGAGKELNRLSHLWSSSCLAVNVFEAWREDPEPLGLVLDADLEVNSLEFESKQPTGLGGISPHLDVLLSGKGPTVGIECKFLEMYSTATNQFSDSYFERPGLWKQIPAARDLARRIANEEETFRWLAAAQLLKHALGLSTNQPDGFRLLLVWYRIDGPTADAIAAEIERFSAAIGDIHFSALTYQELVRSLKRFDEPRPGYFAYLADRHDLG